MPQAPDSISKRRPTMTDVAKLAGVSQSTVSMVLNNTPGMRMAEATRTRVLKAAGELGYQLPRREDLSQEPGHRNLIVYLVDEISTSPHPVVSVDGARDAAWQHDCVLSVSVTRNDAEQTDVLLRALLGHPSLLGVVYSTIFTRQVDVPAALADVPTVLLNCHSPGSKYASVLPGEVGGGQAATEHLIAQGHSRIGFINGEAWMEAAEDRFKGYRRALATADLPFDSALVRHGDWMSSTGFEHTLSLLGEPRPPTAIFCANDLMALGAIEAAKQMGLRVPEDVSIMGYDDQEISRHTHPPLTTVVLPNYEMGRVAVETLLEIVQDPTRAARRQVVKIDCPVVVRESVLQTEAHPEALTEGLR
jgi:LacI family transcriptional regulator